MRITSPKKSALKIAATKIEQELNEISEINQKKFQNVLLHSPNIFIILEGFPEMIITFANEPLYKSWGKTAAILGKPLMEVVPEIIDQTFPALLRQVFETGTAHYSTEERAVIHINGNPFDRYYNYVYQPIFDDNQKVTGVTVMATDITELVLSQKKIKESEKQKAYLLKLSDALRSFGHPVEIEATATKIALDFMDADRCYFGSFEKGNAIVLRDAYREGLTSLAAVYPLSDFALLLAAIDSGRPFVIDDVNTSVIVEESLKEMCTQVHVLSMIIVPIIKNDKATGVFVVAQSKPRKWTKEEVQLCAETTERILAAVERAKAEEALSISEEKHRTLLTSINKGFTLCELIRNKEGKGIDICILEVNSTYEKLTGINKEMVIGKPLLQVFPLLDKWIIDAYAAVVDNQQPAEFDSYFEDTERWFAIKAYPVAKDRFAVLFGDITKQKQASQYARSLIEASLDPLVTISTDGKITDVNEASIKVTGVEREKLIDTDFSNYFTEPQKAQEGYQQVFEKGFVADYPLTIKHKNGNLTDVLYNASVYKDDKGNVLGVFAAARDVTEQKWAIDLSIANKELAFQNEEKEKRAAELIIANKELAFQNEEKEKRAEELVILVKELEAFNYITSHDLQEPLRQIQMFGSRINDVDLQHISDAGKTYFEKINNAAKRMQNLINDLLAYSRSKTEARRFKKISINQIFNEVKEEFEEIISDKQATIEVAELGVANVITFQFRQMMYNLIGNALKFSKPDTPPHIIIKSELVKSNQVPGANHETEREYYHISITDNGIGFEEQYKNRIFEVFQRLHDKQKIAGTGIGLAIVKNIVENHNGFIKATGELNKGATFDIYIPTIQKL